MPVKKTYTQLSIPPKWNSAHQPIRFIYDMPTEPSVIYNYNSEGFLSVSTTSAFMNNASLIQVGDIVYIVNAGIYTGYHVVKRVITQNVFNVAFQLNTSIGVLALPLSADVKYATPPVWSVWKGNTAGEFAYPTPYPYEIVAEFQPEGNLDGFLEFDISGYVQAAMLQIVPPSEGTFVFASQVYEYRDFNLFMPFRILTSTYFEQIFLALNSAIDTDILNSKYVDTFQFLQEYPVSFLCGQSIGTIVNGDLVWTYRGVDAPMELPVTGFDSGFSSGFFKT